MPTGVGRPDTPAGTFGPARQHTVALPSSEEVVAADSETVFAIFRIRIATKEEMDGDRQ